MPAGSGRHGPPAAPVAVDETVKLLHPPLPLVGVSMAMERERRQNQTGVVSGSVGRQWRTVPSVPAIAEQSSHDHHSPIIAT